MTTKASPAERSISRELLYFDIASDISRASSTESLQRVCRQATRALGYDYYLFGCYYPIVEGIVLSSNYPAAWRERYDSHNYVAIDPVVRHCWSDSRPVLWDRLVYSAGKQGQQEQLVMREASEHGLRFGISVPVHGAGAEGGMLSLVSSERRENPLASDETGLHIIVHAMHEATKRILSRTTDRVSDGFERLSPREIECLSWTAKGKTSWAIARILAVSENTVTFHLRNAIRKLEVTNRSQAVAKAISLSKIMPF
ncbi:LuxR family transcriptional regulator [Granulosicoccus sp. 3-233]|uniref:LuxR family transcriptional regulator n=1 Tax=Granulosicoccus sp. 3-233 TaxID=3417969 RepID=UPI003D32D674